MGGIFAFVSVCFRIKSSDGFSPWLLNSTVNCFRVGLTKKRMTSHKIIT